MKIIEQLSVTIMCIQNTVQILILTRMFVKYSSVKNHTNIRKADRLKLLIFLKASL